MAHPSFFIPFVNETVECGLPPDHKGPHQPSEGHPLEWDDEGLYTKRSTVDGPTKATIDQAVNKIMTDQLATILDAEFAARGLPSRRRQAASVAGIATAASVVTQVAAHLI
jgi:hypothetical protein